MRQSDAAAALAILCGTLIGAEIFRQANPPQATEMIPQVRVVELPVETQVVQAVPSVVQTDRRVELRVTSLDPTREAHLEIELNGHPIGATTDVMTPFRLISTSETIEGHLSTLSGDPNVRVELREGVQRSGHPIAARAEGRDFLFDSGRGLQVRTHNGHH